MNAIKKRGETEVGRKRSRGKREEGETERRRESVGIAGTGERNVRWEEGLREGYAT